jgi:DNA ligase D-like protein (predicted 3'-phosphoesterase)
MPRYVILYHDCPCGEPRPTHWDFMLEAEGVLRSWALPEPPSHSDSLIAVALNDHRADYLDYEGPVSRGRGSVSRWDWGTYSAEDVKPDRLLVVLEGEKLHGQVSLVRLADESQRWRFAFSPR